MPSRKLRTIENLIMITFPLVLFVGCAGGDIKPDIGEQPQATTSESQAKGHANSNTEVSDLTTISLVEPGTEPDKVPQIQQEEIVESTPGFIETSDSTDVKHENKLPEKILTEIPQEKIFFFDTNVYTLTEEQRKSLKAHAEFLKTNPGSVLVINGHADERGTEEYNQSLSDKRARETFNLLIKLGVAQDQLVTKAFGELAPMHSESYWDENRRVELEYNYLTLLSSM